MEPLKIKKAKKLIGVPGLYILYFVIFLVILGLFGIILEINFIQLKEGSGRTLLYFAGPLAAIAILVWMGLTLKKADKEIILKKERESLLDRMKSEFISIAAHQLRTPLSSVKWILKMLLDGDFGPLSLKQHEFSRKGYEANERMIHLVNDLLDVSRIEEGRFGFMFGQNDFNKFMKETIQSFSGASIMKNVKIVFEADEYPLSLFFDPGRLKLALTNIMDNALNYTPARGQITVSVKKEENEITVGIKDTGVGIPESQKHRIFTKFFRGDNVVRMQTEGTGLGLFLAKNIIEKHGGRIWFESDEGKGATFYFTIPMEKNKELDGHPQEV